ncbi:MBL fold metallo-hydrolase [Salinibacter altiplanensis]|uniref:MBL fold metallo-hydrolase n=1 Tax=Salinibacter altiplanensis TaxID=1803181 RepID=UPI000C9EF423|nr:MBL fold metallo-hydrolase [Salinibacter altiplanensis]
MIDRIDTLDLHFQDQRHIIAAYLLPHADGVALIETGPGSTFPMLQAQLAERGLTPADISAAFLTHVHLDHGGAAGHLARHGTTIYAHRIGVPHLSSPERLLTSAERIYGDDMDALWGEMPPVPEAQLVALDDGDTVSLGGEKLTALDTPGHASHHMSYVVGDVCFTGDVGGVRMPGEHHVELPLAPPEIDLDAWRESLTWLRTAADHHDLRRLAPTHFGLYDDLSAHLHRLETALEAADEWAAQSLPGWDDGEEALQDAVTDWMREQAAAESVGDDAWAQYELANPSWMAAQGLHRYWTTQAS